MGVDSKERGREREKIETKTARQNLCVPPLSIQSTNMEAVQTFGRKKTATAVAHCKRGRGLIRINGSPLELLEPEILKFKVYEVILLLGEERFANVDIRNPHPRWWSRFSSLCYPSSSCQGYCCLLPKVR
ncbi:unnamed protein product [Rhizopus microsporus]